MKIFLVGMPGSGKTTFGKQLAARLMIEFVDLDAEIERAEAKTIPQIFNDHGEEYFRLVESRLLREWSAVSTSFVMATGGGAPCFFQGMDAINQSGISIFLDVPVSRLIARVKENKGRPLLLHEGEEHLREKVTAMRNSRLECYRKSHIITQDPSLADVVEKIKAIG